MGQELVISRALWFFVKVKAHGSFVFMVLAAHCFILGCASSVTKSSGSLCSQWSRAKVAGNLDTSKLNETSGMALSSDGTRLYHVNDSGDSGRFFSTDLDGSALLEHRVLGFVPRDMESLALGPCGAKNKCLFIGDIGDNKRSRDQIKVVVINEKDIGTNPQVKAQQTLYLKYPDSPHNAEGLAVDAGGNIYILTKENFNSYSQAQPAKLFGLSFDRWFGAKKKLNLALIGTLDLPSINADLDPRSQVVTGFTLAPYGGKALVLTYENAIEFVFALLRGGPPKPWTEGIDYQKIKLKALEQQEAVVYSASPDEFIYSTESEDNAAGLSPLYRVRCLGN